MFKKALIAAAAVASIAAHAGPTYSSGSGFGSASGLSSPTVGNGGAGGGAGTSFSITQGGVTGTATLGSTSIGAQSGTTTTSGTVPNNTLVKSYYDGSVSFDASSWTVSDTVVFHPSVTVSSSTTVPVGTAWSTSATTYVSQQNINDYVTDVKTLISNAVTNEVSYINGLVGTYTNAITTYNSAVRFDETEADRAASAEGQAVDSAKSALSAEVTATGSAVTAIKALSVTTAYANTGSVVTSVSSGNPVGSNKYDGHTVVLTTGGNTTISSGGSVTLDGTFNATFTFN